jgi:hypothetical protein
MFKRFLPWLIGLALLVASFVVEREARRRERLADQREAELLRIQNDQAELQNVRLRLRAARDAEMLRLALAPRQKKQRQLLTALRGRAWTRLEWESAGFYVEGPGVEEAGWEGSSLPVPGRLAGHWK